MTFEHSFAHDVFKTKYAITPDETWEELAHRVTSNVMAAVSMEKTAEAREIEQLIADRKFIPGGRYLYAAGRSLHQTQNCLLLRAEDSREGWGDLWQKAGMALMTGAGIGVDYGDIRAEGQPVRRTGGKASGPLSLAYSVNEIGRQVMQGGSRRSAIWMGLPWHHPDIHKFIRMKDWSPELRAIKEKDPTFPAPMELTNISVQLDDAFFLAMEDGDPWAWEVYTQTCKRMLKTGEPGFSIDCGLNAGETLRNACTEVTSADDSDICNLGSLNMAAFSSMDGFREAVDMATLFLLAGTVYSHVPYAKVADVREKNRRLGLGLMGVHEWLLQRGKTYGPDSELAQWLEVYTSSDTSAAFWAHELSLSRPLKTRAIAPTGTIAILAETTTAMEPIFCIANVRRWSKGGGWHEEYVIDPTAQRIIRDQGITPDEIEDAYSLDWNDRVDMQTFMQRYVDHGISSTINLSRPVESQAKQLQFAEMLLPKLPQLRGITVYPNGARGGQPITPVSYEEAMRHHAVIKDEEERCLQGVCSV